MNLVTFDNSPQYRDLTNKMVYACRYIGFDPSVILRKLVRCRSHREARRLLRQNFTLIFEHNGETSNWSYTNHQSFLNDMTFLLITFLQREAVISKISKKNSIMFLS